MEKFSVMNTVMFVTKNAKNFHFIGAIPEVMLSKVPTKNEIVEIYQKIINLDDRYISPYLHVILDAGNVHRRAGVKRKVNVVEEDVSMKQNPKRKLKKKAKVCS